MSQNSGSNRIKSITKKYSELIAGEEDSVTKAEAMLLHYISNGVFSSSRGFPVVIPEYQL